MMIFWGVSQAETWNNFNRSASQSGVKWIVKISSQLCQSRTQFSSWKFLEWAMAFVEFKIFRSWVGEKFFWNVSIAVFTCQAGMRHWEMKLASGKWKLMKAWKWTNRQSSSSSNSRVEHTTITLSNWIFPKMLSNEIIKSRFIYDQGIFSLAFSDSSESVKIWCVIWIWLIFFFLVWGIRIGDCVMRRGVGVSSSNIRLDCVFIFMLLLSSSIHKITHWREFSLYFLSPS